MIGIIENLMPVPLVWFQCQICKLCYETTDSLMNHCTIKHGKFSPKLHSNCIFLKDFSKLPITRIKPDPSPKTAVTKCKKELIRQRLKIRCHYPPANAAKNPKYFSALEPEITQATESIPSGKSKSRKPFKKLASNSKPEFHCNKCDKTFTTKSGSKTHRLKYCPFSEYKQTKPLGLLCKLCENILPSKRQLHMHRVTEHPEVNWKPFICSICNNRFSKKSALNYHIKQIHNSANLVPKPCKFCGKTFNCDSRLKRHELIHTNSNRFKCPLCPKSFPRTDQLQCHARIHTDGKSYVCPFCRKGYHHGSSFKKHMNTHTNELQFKCTWPECTSEFKHLLSLKVHEKNCHFDKDVPKPFICEICDKTFPFREYLRLHKRVHSGLKNFTCHLCNFKCSQNSNLKCHIAGIHSDGRKSINCTYPKCPKNFKDKYHMRQHLKRHTQPKRFKCYFCAKKFFYKASVTSHLVTHTKEKHFMCQLEKCRKQFGFSSSLRMHMRRHTKY